LNVAAQPIRFGAKAIANRNAVEGTECVAELAAGKQLARLGHEYFCRRRNRKR
jgi:hypothetical protein